MECKDSEAVRMLDLDMEQLSLIDVAQENDDLIPPLCDYVFPESSLAKVKRKCHDARTILDGQENKEAANNTVAIVNQQSTSKPISTKLPLLIESPGTTKRNYLRQSLPWDPAFFTEPGLLDEDELIAYTNMKSKQDPGTSNATKNEVGAHSNSAVVKGQKLKANFSKTKGSCAPRASVATPQQQANRTHMPSHKRAPSASVISLQNPSQGQAKVKRRCHDVRTTVDGQENKKAAVVVNQRSYGKPVSTKLQLLTESPGTAKKNYLRQSLPWDPAFFTEPGLLDEDELIAYTNMKSKQDPGTSNATKNEVGAHSNSTVVKGQKLKANFSKTKGSCAPRASVATPQQQANRTHMPSHKRAPSASVISLQNPSQGQVVGKDNGHLSSHKRAPFASGISLQNPGQLVGKDNWRSPLGKSVVSSILLDKNKKHKRGLSSLSLSSPSAFQDALSSQTPHTFLRKGGGVRFFKKVDAMEKYEQKQKHATKEHFQLGASPIMMTNSTLTKTAATQPNKDAEKKAFFTKAFARKFTSVSKTTENTLGKVLPGNKSKNAPPEKKLPHAPQDNLSCNLTSMANASSSTDKHVALNRCPSLNPAAFEPYSKPKPGMFVDNNLQKLDSTTVFSANEPTFDEISGRASLMNQSSSIYYTSNLSLKKKLFPRESFKHVETSGQSMIIGNKEGIAAAAIAGNSSMKNTNVMSSNGSRPSGLRMPSLKMGFFDINTWFYL